MITIIAKHLPYYDGHLGEVMREMEHAGPPTIRAIEYQGKFFALEGSHRLASAYMTGLIPKVILVEVDCDDGCQTFFQRVDQEMHARELPEYTFDHLLVLREADFR